MNIAFFDFDGTITTDDSLLKFIRFVVGDINFLIGLSILSPMLILYKLKLIPNYKAKQIMLSYFFKGMEAKRFEEVANSYSLTHIQKILRPKAMEKIRWHQMQGHKVVVVSALLECWLRPWCEQNTFELIATKLEIKENKVSGDLRTKNCYGIEKVNRINEKYDLHDYEIIYAYGDSRGDKEMLSLANEAHYKPFRYR